MSESLRISYKIEVVQTRDEEEILDFLHNVFYKDEPICNSIGLSESPGLDSFSLKDFDQGISFKAVSEGKLLGICLSNIVLKKNTEDDTSGNSGSDQAWVKIEEFLGAVYKETNLFSQFPGVEKALDAKILGVNGSCRGQGVGKALLDKTREAARQQGCKVMFSVCTSHFTGKALKSLGFDCIYSRKFEDYKIDGKIVFPTKPPHVAVTVYAQKI